MRKLTGLIMTATGVLYASASARALPPEYLGGLALHPRDPNVFVLRYESAGGGFLFTRDGGKTFTSHPARPFMKYGITGRAPFVISSDGQLLVGQLDGLFSDRGSGCIEATPTLAAWVADFAPHPLDPELSFLVTTGNTKGVHAGLWKRDRAGALSSFGVSEPLVAGASSYQGLVVHALQVVARAASDQGLRFVQVAIRYTTQDGHMVPSPVLRFSDDMGATWTERALPDPGPTKGTPHLLAVSATTPMKVVVAMEMTGPDPEPSDPVLYSADDGQTFVPYISEIKSAYASLFLPDGRLLVGERGAAGGLWLADALGATPRKVASFPVHCLGYHAKSQRVYMCKPYEFGQLDLATWSFCSQFQLNEVRSLSCATFDAAQLTTVQMQLCSGWCGPGHYASSELCSRYDDPAQLCGVPARAYDLQNPDPDKRWLEPPGLLAAMRCAGSSPPPPPVIMPAAAVDAGVVAQRAADAAVDARDRAVDAAVDAGSVREAGVYTAVAPSLVDSEASQRPRASEQREPEPDSSEVSEDRPVGSARTRGGGCQLRAAGSPTDLLTLLLLTPLAALFRRRARY